MKTRTDIHKPSSIDPADYVFVGQEVFKIEGFGDLEIIIEERKRIQEHMARTGGTYSGHEHGGNCMVCGAHAIYTILFYHEKSNSYVRMGQDCAEKCECGNEVDFRSFRLALKDALELKTGKTKAQAILKSHELSTAWDIYNSTVFYGDLPKEEQTLKDMVGNLVKYGNFSEKQISYAKTLLLRIVTRPEREAKMKAEREAAKDCPVGKVEIIGIVLSTKMQASDFGDVLKMTVKSVDGFIVYGSVPSSLCAFDDAIEGGQRNLRHGDKVKFSANLTPSYNDKKFGFFKRPTKAEMVKA